MKALLLKNMILKNQIFMKYVFYLMILLNITQISFLILSNIDLFMISNLQKFLLMNKSISQLLIGIWNLKLKSMVSIKKIENARRNGFIFDQKNRLT